MWQRRTDGRYRENDLKFRYMRALWHGEVPLIEDLDNVFERQEEEKIDHIRQTIRAYEKEIEKRGTEIVDRERTQAERADGKKKKAK